MLDLPIQFISPDEIPSSQQTHQNASLDAERIDFDQLSNSEQKALVLHLIDRAILGIENQNRYLTEWEADTLTGVAGVQANNDTLKGVEADNNGQIKK